MYLNYHKLSYNIVQVDFCVTQAIDETNVTSVRNHLEIYTNTVYCNAPKDVNIIDNDVTDISQRLDNPFLRINIKSAANDYGNNIENVCT